MKSKLPENDFSHFINESEKEILIYVLNDIEKQLNEILKGTKKQVETKAYGLIVHIDVSPSDSHISRKELDSRIQVSFDELYNYLILFDSPRFTSILKKLLKIEQEVYVIHEITITHLIYLLNKSVDDFYKMTPSRYQSQITPSPTKP